MNYFRKFNVEIRTKELKRNLVEGLLLGLVYVILLDNFIQWAMSLIVGCFRVLLFIYCFSKCLRDYYELIKIVTDFWFSNHYFSSFLQPFPSNSKLFFFFYFISLKSLFCPASRHKTIDDINEIIKISSIPLCISLSYSIQNFI